MVSCLGQVRGRQGGGLGMASPHCLGDPTTHFSRVVSS